MTPRELSPATLNPWSSRRSFVFDLALTLGLLLGVVVMVSSGQPVRDVLFSVLEIAPLVLRRTHPATSFALVSVFMAVQIPFVDAPVWGQVAMPVSVYAVTANANRAQARTAIVIALLAGIAGPVSWLRTYAPGNDARTLLILFVLTELLVILPATFGFLTRTRRAYVSELIDRGHQLAREAEQRAELAASDERARIAREMHDVIAHGLSVMIVQADGASYAVHKDPDTASRAMTTISDTGRESLAEMRRLLGLLRADGDAASGTRPQPGLADLGYLVEQARGAGTEVVDEMAPDLPVVAAGVGLTVFRIVQEGLTNVRKHAGPGATVTVSVRHVGPRILVEIADDGRGPGPSDTGTDHDAGGHGLIGMRERVAVHRGSLHTGPRSGGGFVLRAEVPTDGSTD